MKKMTQNLFGVTLLTVMLGFSSNVFSQENVIIDGDQALKDYIAANPDAHKTVQDFTLKNISPEVSQSYVHLLSGCVSTINGTAMWDKVQYSTTENFFNTIACKGSIIVQNCDSVSNPNGFSGYTVINGDFILKNCPKLITGFGEGWEKDAFTHITKVTGDFRLINIGRISGLSIGALKEVGGDFEISGCNTMFWDFKAGIKLETIGGDFILNNNAVFENLMGIENIKSIGGNISIVDNAGVLGAYSPDWENGTFSNAKGFCLLATWKQNNVFSPTAKVTLKQNGNDKYVDVNKLVPCGETHDDDYYLGISSAKADQELVITLVNGNITISAPWEMYKVEVYDMSGSLVYKTVATEKIYVCNDLNLQPGAYAVRVGGANVSVGRLIIVK